MGGPASGPLPAGETAPAPPSHGPHRGPAPIDTAPGAEFRARMMRLHSCMMADSIIHRRVWEDGEMRRLIQDMESGMSSADHGGMQDTMACNRRRARQPEQPRTPDPPVPGRDSLRPEPADSAAQGGHNHHSRPEP
jgi:hypothetical protein